MKGMPQGSRLRLTTFFSEEEKKEVIKERPEMLCLISEE
jgi:hypothetical protein